MNIKPAHIWRMRLARYISLMLAIMLSARAGAQSWKPAYAEFESLVNAQDFAAAIAKGGPLLAAIEKENKVQDTTYADVAYYMGYAHFVQKEYDKAVMYATAEHDIRRRLQGKNHPSYINATYLLAVYLAYIPDYAKAIPYMQEVVEAMEKEYGKKDKNYLHMANQLANLYNVAGSTYKAEQLYTENWNTVKQNYQPVDSMFQVMVNTISVFYFTSGNYEKAEPFYADAVKQQEKYYTKQSPNYMASLKSLVEFYTYAAMYEKGDKAYEEYVKLSGDMNGRETDEYMTLYNSWGEFYINAGMYPKSEQVYTEFVKMAEKKYGKKSADYATALNNLAVTYEKQGKNKQAEETYLKSLAIKESVYTKKSNFYALTLMNLGVLYDNMGQYAKATDKLEEAIGIYEEISKTDSDNYATALSSIASVYSSNGNNAKAQAVLERSLAISLKNAGELSEAYISALNNLANIRAEMGDYAKAEKDFTEAARLREKLSGPNHTNLGITLFNLANLKTEQGKYTEAENLLLRAKNIQQRAVGEYHEAYINVLQSLASLYAAMGQYRKAGEYYDDCGRRYEKIYGALHPQLAVFLSNQGLFYFQVGDYEKAGENFDRALKIHRDAFGSKHPGNLNILSNKANLQIARNQYKEAETNLLEANAIARDYYGINHADYAATLNNLATLYYELGNYPKAQTHYEEALATRKKIYGDKHAEYATSLNNLGALFLAQAQAASLDKDREAYAARAVSHFKQALAVDSLVYGPENAEMAAHYNNLAEAHRLQNNFGAAETLYLQSLAVEEKNFGANNPRSAVTQHNLALLYSGAGDYAKAEAYALKSIAAFDKNFGPASPNSAGVTASLAHVYDLQGKTEKAALQYAKALAIQRAALERNFAFLSEGEKEKFLASVALYNDMYSAFVLKAKATDPKLTVQVYANELYTKGILFRSSSRVKSQVLASGNAALINTYNAWIDTKQQLATVYAQPLDQRKFRLDSLEERANQLEKQLVAASAELKGELQQQDGPADDMGKNLAAGQAAIEFTHFISEEQDVYCALIMKPGMAYPEMVKMCSAAELEAVMGKNAANNGEYIHAVYGKKGKLNAALYDLVWKPMEAQLQDVKEIYYAPSGLLHRVAFAALANHDGKYVSADYTLHTLGSTAQLPAKAAPAFESKGSVMAMFGGVNYDTDNTTQEVWKYLPGTMSEAQHIQKLASASGLTVQAYTGTGATEASLKALSGKASPQLLHMATHGFCYGNPESIKQELTAQVGEVNFRGGSRGTRALVENTNPLMRSGIVLAGANDVWNEQFTGAEDGVLTAYEVSLMDLQNTQLAVLSACETGLGDIKGSEGVYGLQRAFRVAGAGKVVMSLWQVPDKETEEFMVLFYTQLIRTKNIHQAFAAAQQQMQQQYDPYFWAAFVLLE